MRIFYHNGFYFDDGFIAIPEEAVEITETEYRALFEGQSKGKLIQPNKQGKPMLTEQPPSEFHQFNLDTEQWEISAKHQPALLTQHRNDLIQKLAEKADEIKNQILVGYPQAEIDSFYRQEREARAWLEDKTLLTPMLSAIAQNREIPLDILVNKVIKKADKLAEIMGQIIGTRQAFESRIQKAKNLDELTACEQEIAQWKLSI